jgi:protocatechuate 3,4-dioxygenase beta subunit
MDRGRHLLSRREALAAAGAGALALYGVACGDDNKATPTSTAATGNSSAESASCVLTPEQTEGPYYIADSLIRRDITEDRDGTPLELRLRVQDAESCDSVKNATVEVWHSDALGVYSGFGQASGERTFLRGGQKSDADGNVTFRTIYPGWYQGRTPHIHVKVHAGGEEVHTGQLYFDDDVSAAVYRKAPYESRGEPTTTNSTDGVYANGGDQSVLALTKDGDGYVGRLALGVRV